VGAAITITGMVERATLLLARRSEQEMGEGLGGYLVILLAEAV